MCLNIFHKPGFSANKTQIVTNTAFKYFIEQSNVKIHLIDSGSIHRKCIVYKK